MSKRHITTQQIDLQERERLEIEAAEAAFNFKVGDGVMAEGRRGTIDSIELFGGFNMYNITFEESGRWAYRANQMSPLRGLVWAYDHTGNNLVLTPVCVGDEVDWKRRGVRGFYRAELVAISLKRIKLRLLHYSDRPTASLEAARPVWTRKEVLRVYPKGK